MQAMERNRNDPKGEVRAYGGHRPGAPEPSAVVRWVAAGFVAAAALLGLVVLVLLISVALQPPRWVQMVLGVAMAIGTAVFAWLVASALRDDDQTGPR